MQDFFFILVINVPNLETHCDFLFLLSLGLVAENPLFVLLEVAGHWTVGVLRLPFPGMLISLSFPVVNTYGIHPVVTDLHCIVLCCIDLLCLASKLKLSITDFGIGCACFVVYC